MSDLIDRQATIDVLEERIKANGYLNVALVSELNRIIGYLNQLPSAQPQQICEYWDSESNFCTLHRPSAQPEITVAHALTEEEIKNIKQKMAEIPIVLMPSAQPEIIRCMDCKYRFVDGENVRFNVCELNHNILQSDDWFCSDGERKQ